MNSYPTDILASITDRALDLILFPTEKCNFRCSYCYEDFEKGRMPPALIGGIKRFLDSRYETLDRLVISWFGGEPLLASDIIVDVSQHIRSLQRRRSDLSYEANITTNGYLLSPSLFEELNSLGVTLYQISIDGVGAKHDKTRLKANGTGTFDRIITNLRAIRDNTKSNACIILRLHYSPDSIENLSDTVAFINDEFASDPRFKIYVKAIEQLGGNNDSAIRTYTADSQNLISEVLHRKLDDMSMAYSIESDSRYICYAAKANSFGIRPDGTIVKCTVALSDDRNTVGSIDTDGNIVIQNDRIRPWLHGLAVNNDKILACPFKHMGNHIKSDVVRESIGREQAKELLMSSAGNCETCTGCSR